MICKPLLHVLLAVTLTTYLLMFARIFIMNNPMSVIAKIPREGLYVSKPVWWLESRFHFSFAEYRHPTSNGFGALFVLNDDLVKPHAGFGAHPHRDAEIFSYVVDGELSHQDSMGNKESLPRGSVQYLSAGSGIVHSEMNDGGALCRFLQVWIRPNRRGVTPQYGSSQHEKSERHNKWLHLLGGTAKEPKWPDISPASNIQLHQDCNVLVTETDPAKDMELTVAAGRRMYMVCIEGDVAMSDGTSLSTRDAVGVEAPDSDCKLKLKAGDSGMHLIAIEMAMYP